MKKIIDFLAQTPAFYIATVDENNEPRVRPFSFVMEYNGKLTFSCGKSKKVYKQLQQNPNIEICSFAHTTGEWIRITGKVVFTDNIEAKKKVFEVMPELKNIYQSENNPELACFYIDKGQVATYSFKSPEPTIENI